MCSGFWSDVVSTIIGAGVGAFLAFELERRRRNAEQRRQEVGQCHKLICLLANRLNVLQDFHDSLFAKFEKKHGQAPRWDQVPALDGAPDQTDDIPIGDYVFLLDGREHESDAPAVLRRVQLSTINTNSALALLARRNHLWHEREGIRRAFVTQLGGEGAAAMGRAMALNRSLEELTCWVRAGIEEEVSTLHSIFDQLYQVMAERFPKEKLLHLRPLDGGLPLGHGGGATAPPPTQ